MSMTRDRLGVLALFAFAALTACGSGEPRDRFPDAESACPAGAMAPLDSSCSDEGLRCRYGYDVPGCGGRTVICSDGRWSELEHTDPTQGCGSNAVTQSGPDVDAGPSRSLAVATDAGPAAHAAPATAVGRDHDAAPPPRSFDPICQFVTPSSGCSYVRTEGTATLTAIEAAPQVDTDSACTNTPVTVRFAFEPDDPARSICFHTDEEHSNTSRFYAAGGVDPPLSCLRAAGLRVGSKVRVTREDIAIGTCTPVLFSFPSELENSCLEACQF